MDVDAVAPGRAAGRRRPPAGRGSGGRWRVLGPALGRGVVLAYDLAWSPDPRLTPFTLGTSTPAPRAVPSDAAGVVLGWLLGAGVAQALVLWGTLVLAGAGAARLTGVLVPGAGWAARSAAAVAAIWNPFVLERLVVGQWTVLLGYAAVPHLLVTCLRVRSGRAPSWAPAVGLAACGVGGANTLVIGGLAVAGVLLVAPAPLGRARPRRCERAGGVGRVGAAGRHGGGGLGARRRRRVRGACRHSPRGAGVTRQRRGLLEPGVTPCLPPGASSSRSPPPSWPWSPCSPPRRRHAAREWAHSWCRPSPACSWRGSARSTRSDCGPLWSSTSPVGASCATPRSWSAPWVVLAAAGAGVLVRDLLRVRAAGPAMAVLVTALPVALVPTLAWGVGGRVTAVAVPDDLRTVASMLSAAPAGSVGLLPWSQYRRYGWNGDRVSLTLVPRMVDQRVVLDDGLPLANGVVPGEDPVARAVTARIAAGTPPLQALAEQGVRWVVVEKDTGWPDPVPVADGTSTARLVHDGPAVRVLELDGAGAAPPARAATRWGWAVTCVTWLAALGCVVLRRARARPTHWYSPAHGFWDRGHRVPRGRFRTRAPRDLRGGQGSDR